MVGRWCSGGDASPPANQTGTKGTGGSNGGRTVHLSSPDGEGLLPLDLTGLCLLLGPLDTLVPKPAHLQMWSARLIDHQPADGLPLGPGALRLGGSQLARSLGGWSGSFIW